MNVVTYGSLTFFVAILAVIGTVIFAYALGEDNGRKTSRNSSGVFLGLVFACLWLFVLTLMIGGGSLHGSIGNVANDPLNDGLYRVVSSAQWDEDTLAIVLVGLDEKSSTRPRFHLVDNECFRGSSLPSVDDEFEMRTTRNAHFCEVLTSTPS